MRKRDDEKRGRKAKGRGKRVAKKVLTEAQLATVRRFTEVSRLSSDLVEACKLGLDKYAKHLGMQRHRYFRRINNHFVNEDGVQYEEVIVSKGPVLITSMKGVEIDGYGVMRVKWWVGGSMGMEDWMWVWVYCPSCHLVVHGKPVERRMGVMEIALPDELSGKKMYVYAFFKDRAGWASDTMFAGVVDGERWTEKAKYGRDKVEKGGQKSEKGGQKTEKVSEKGGQKILAAVKKGGQKTQMEIVRIMKEEPVVSTSEMAKRLGVNRSALSKHIKRLKEAGLIERIGGDKGGKWVVKVGDE